MSMRVFFILLLVCEGSLLFHSFTCVHNGLLRPFPDGSFNTLVRKFQRCVILAASAGWALSPSGCNFPGSRYDSGVCYEAGHSVKSPVSAAFLQHRPYWCPGVGWGGVEGSPGSHLTLVDTLVGNRVPLCCWAGWEVQLPPRPPLTPPCLGREGPLLLQPLCSCCCCCLSP